MIKHQPNQLSIRNKLFNDYCKQTSIHGISFIHDKNRSILERIVWIIIFLLSLLFCSAFIISIWDKKNENPVIVTFADKSISMLSVNIFENFHNFLILYQYLQNRLIYL